MINVVVKALKIRVILKILAKQNANVVRMHIQENLRMILQVEHGSGNVLSTLIPANFTLTV